MNWCLDLSWKSFRLKIQSMCALRAKISEHLYTGFSLHLSRGQWPQEGRQEFMLQDSWDIITNQPHKCAHNYGKRAQGPTGSITKWQGWKRLWKWSYLTSSIGNSHPQQLWQVDPGSVWLHPGIGYSLPLKADHFHIWTVKFFGKCFWNLSQNQALSYNPNFLERKDLIQFGLGGPGQHTMELGWPTVLGGQDCLGFST